MNETRDRSLHWLAIVLALTVLAYWPALTGTLVYDDTRFIRDNQAIRSLANARRFFTDPSTLSANYDRDIYRPLRTLSFAVDYALVGEQPLLYHVENLLYHLAAAVALFFLLGEGRWFDPTSRLLVTAAFALHPAITEAVAWISSRGDVMAGCFVITACLVYVRRARAIVASSRSRIALLVLAALALLAKESAVVLAPLLVVLQLALRRPVRRAQIADIAFVIGLGLAYVLLRQWVLATDSVSQVARQGASEQQHYLYVARALVEYLRLCAFPYPLTVDYGDRYFALPGKMFLLSTAIAVIAFLLLTLALRREVPWLPLGIAWFLVALFPTSNLLVRVKALVAERFLYLPLIGVLLAITSLIPASFRRFAFVLLLPLGWLTFARCHEWRSQEALFASALHVWPGSIQARMALADLALKRGASDAANQLYQEVLERTARADVRHLEVRFQFGRQAFARNDFATAVTQLRAIRLTVHEVRGLERRLGCYPEALLALGESLRQLRELGQAAEVLAELVALDGRQARSLLALGLVLDTAGHPERARGVLEEAAHKAPEDATCWLVLGLFHERQGDSANARRALERATALEPGNEVASAALKRLVP